MMIRIKKTLHLILSIVCILSIVIPVTEANDDDLESMLREELDVSSEEEEESLGDEELQDLPKVNKGTKAEIKILDKVSTKLTTVEYNLMSRNYYKNFEIIVFNCIKPTQKMENHKMLIGIWEHKEQQGMDRIFLGWLFSIDKNLSQIEHRFFNIADFRCK